MAIDFAGDLEEILGLGDLPEVTGTLERETTTLTVTGAAITRRRRLPHAGSESDMEELTLLVAASGVDGTPVADMRGEFDGIDGVWVVVAAEPIGPGGAIAGWTLTLRTWTER